MKALEDLQGKTEKEVKEHLASQYSDETESGVEQTKKILKDYNVLLAYESVGSWGCDSSSFFLLKHKKNGKLFEVHGSHCSCYGFEGQFSLEPTVVKALKDRVKNGGNVFCAGGYDGNETENQRIAREFVLTL